MLTNQNSLAPIVISGKVNAIDGPNQPRREIKVINKEERQLVTRKGASLDVSTAESRFGANWNKEGKVLWIPITLLIGSEKYSAFLHYRKASQGLWIGSPLDGGKVKLAEALASIDLKGADIVKLHVQENTIRVTR